MSSSGETPFEARPPRVGEVIALLVIVPAVGAAARALSAGGLTTPHQSAIVVGAAAGLVGLPALAWLFERGRLTVTALASMGAVAGAVPPLLLAISGAVGLLFLGGAEYASWALGKGASIPIYGSISWPRFLQLLGWSMSVGASSGVIYAALIPDSRWRQPLSWVVAAITLAAVVAIGKLFS